MESEVRSGNSTEIELVSESFCLRSNHIGMATEVTAVVIFEVTLTNPIGEIVLFNYYLLSSSLKAPISQLT